MARPTPVFVSDATPAPSASHAEFEERLRADPEDADLAHVYTDWLSERGDPRGELGAAQLAGDAERERAILAAHDGWRNGVSDKVATITWRAGRMRRVRLMNRADWMSSTFDTKLVAERLFSQPAANCLEELAVGVLRWEYQSADLDTLLTDASTRPFAPGLRTLRLGDCGDIDIDNAHHEIGGLVDLRAFRRLETLTMWGGQIAPPVLDLPNLRTLALQTCGLDRGTVDNVLHSTLPKLERLELWFGSENYGSTCTVDDLADLLGGTVLPSVVHLGLCNAEFTDDIVPALLASPILPRLRSVDLSLGTLGDGAAEALMAATGAWKHLETLRLRENFLSEGMITRLASVGPTVLADDQKDDEDYRYVSVSE